MLLTRAQMRPRIEDNSSRLTSAEEAFFMTFRAEKKLDRVLNLNFEDLSGPRSLYQPRMKGEWHILFTFLSNTCHVHAVV